MSLINTAVNVFGNGMVRGIPLKLLRKRNIQKQPWQHWVVSQVRCACQDFLSAVTW